MTEDQRRQILERVARNEISTQEAMALLDDLGAASGREAGDRVEPTDAGPVQWEDWSTRLAEFAEAVGEWTSQISAQAGRLHVPGVAVPAAPAWPQIRVRTMGRGRRGEAQGLYREAAKLRRLAGKVSEQAAELREQAEQVRAQPDDDAQARAQRIEQTADSIQDKVQVLEDKAREVEAQADELAASTEPQTASRSGEYAVRVGSGLGSAISSAVSSAVGSVLRSGPDVTEQISREVSVEGTPTVVIESDAGPVEVTAGPEGAVSLAGVKHAPSTEALERMAVDVVAAGDTVHITYRADDWLTFGRWVHMRVVVPAGCPVRVATSGGRVALEGLRAGAEARTSGEALRVRDVHGPLRLRTSGGDLLVDGVAGPVEAHTSGGNVEVSGSSPSASLRTSGGDVRMSGDTGQLDAATSGGDIIVAGRVDGECRLRTSGGDVSAQEVGGPLDAKTSGGTIRVARAGQHARLRTSGGSIEVDEIDGSVDAHASAGSVTVAGQLVGSSTIRAAEVSVALPDDASVRIQVRSRHAHNDFGLHTDPGGLQGTIGDGAASLEVNATGAVWIRRR